MDDFFCVPTPWGPQCFPIPQLVRRHWWWDDPNPPDPLKVNWIDSDEPWAHDLPALTTINFIVNYVQDAGIRDVLSNAVMEAKQQLSAQLPEGATLEQRERRG